MNQYLITVALSEKPDDKSYYVDKTEYTFCISLGKSKTICAIQDTENRSEALVFDKQNAHRMIKTLSNLRPDLVFEIIPERD